MAEDSQKGPKMLNVKVRSMSSPRGNDVPNQFEIITDDGIYFQSYNSIIAFEDTRQYPHQITLDEKYWKYSVTTSKYRTLFLGESTKETEAKIASGEYKLANLN